MPQDAKLAPGSGPGRTRGAVDSTPATGIERSKAFQRAGRHSTLVASLRTLLPISAIALFASYGVFMQRSISIGWGDKKIEVGKIEINREALVAHNPRYSGFDKNGSAFVVRASTAEQDFKQKGTVRLKAIEGQLTDASRAKTELKATRGTLDTNNNVLEMYERIDVVAANGMTAELTRATVHTKESRIVSTEPVTVRMPSGIVRGQAMTIEQRKKQVLFSGGVVANLKQDARAPRPDGADQATRGASGTGGTTQSGGPVDITSTQLLIDDATKRAIFSGNVVAKQANSVMETAELEVHYEGQPSAQAAPQSDGAATAGAAPTAAGAGGQGKLSKLVAPSKVVLTRGVERVTGGSGEFDALTDRATLMGPVVISGGPDRGATSDRADMDNKNNTIVLTGNVSITGGPDRGATSDRADVDNRNDAMLLTGNVVVTQQKNVLKGRRLQVDRKKGTMQLASPALQGLPKGRISAHLVQAENETTTAARKSAPAPAAKTAPQGPLGAGNLRGDPGQPVDIDADTLDVDDKAKTAVFRGKVIAKQGDYTITTEELVATYSGESGLALGAAPAAGQAQAAQPGNAQGQPKTAAQLQKVTAPRVVDITTKEGQRARGNSAVFDTKANIATLTGDVSLTQGTTITRGPCARLDMNTGSMRILDACGFNTSPDAGASASAAPGSGAGAAAAAGKSPATGRAQLLIFPGQFKEEQKEKAKAKAAATPSAAPSANLAPSSPATATPQPTATPPPAKTTPARREAREDGPASVFGN